MSRGTKRLKTTVVDHKKKNISIFDFEMRERGLVGEEDDDAMWGGEFEMGEVKKTKILWTKITFLILECESTYYSRGLKHAACHVIMRPAASSSKIT